jgi:hypothetical protein
MQQPTGAIATMTVCNGKILFPASCEKITLFRHAILLPKIELPDTFRSSIAQSASLLAHIHDQIQHQTGYNVPGLPVLR